MTQPPLRPPSYLQPRLKAAPTFSSTSLDTIATTTTPHVSRASSRSRQASPTRLPPPTDVSDRATTTLIRRVLCPHTHGGSGESRPIEELLPPLTSSNDVDLQLYAIIAIVVKEFVYSWYGKITQDQGFVEETVRIIAHCTRALEQRLRAVDLESLVLNEIPELVESHVMAYRTSHESIRPPPLVPDSRVVYHTLIPHPAFYPIPDSNVPAAMLEQSKNEAAYRQLLVQGVLAVLLPTEDLSNACLRTLVADVIGEMILGNGISGKACQGWLIWEGITRVLENVKARLQPEATGEEIEVDTRSRLEKSGLLSGDTENMKKHHEHSRSSLYTEIFWQSLQYGYMVFITIRFVILGLVAVSSQSTRSPSPSNSTYKSKTSATAETAKALTFRRPILSLKIFSLISHLLDLCVRMPWLCGSLSLLQYHLISSPPQVGATDGLLDKFLHRLVHTHILAPSRLPTLLHTLRTTLFPHNTLAPPTQVPSPEQQLAIRRKCAATVLGLIPPVVARRFFAVDVANSNNSEEKHADDDDDDDGTAAKAKKTKEAMLKEIEDVLDIFGDAYMNKHLVYGILELCIVRLFPEVGETGVRDLMEGRLGGDI